MAKQLIEIAPEVFLEAHLQDSGSPVICAAHPAGVYAGPTAALLAEIGGTPAVVVNPRGLGGSAPAPDGYNLEAMVDDIEAARRGLGLGPWAFWGMSGGGWLGQIYAGKYPHAISHLILESTCWSFRDRLADPACALSPFFPAYRAALRARGWLAPDSHADVDDPAATEWTELDGLGSVFRRRGGPALLVSPMPLDPEMRAGMPLLWTVDTRAWLSRIRTSALVIASSADPVVLPGRVHALHRALPGSRFLEVAGGGHVPSLERRPEVTQAIRNFLGSR